MIIFVVVISLVLFGALTSLLTLLAVRRRPRDQRPHRRVGLVAKWNSDTGRWEPL